MPSPNAALFLVICTDETHLIAMLATFDCRWHAPAADETHWSGCCAHVRLPAALDQLQLTE